MSRYPCSECGIERDHEEASIFNICLDCLETKYSAKFMKNEEIKAEVIALFGKIKRRHGVKAYCANRGITRCTFYWWVKNA